MSKEIQDSIHYFKNTKKYLSEINLTGLVAHIKAIEALEKQIAISRDIREGRYYCPACKKEMRENGYCKYCGQKLY